MAFQDNEAIHFESADLDFVGTIAFNVVNNIYQVNRNDGGHCIIYLFPDKKTAMHHERLFCSLQSQPFRSVYYLGRANRRWALVTDLPVSISVRAWANNLPNTYIQSSHPNETGDYYDIHDRVKKVLRIVAEALLEINEKGVCYGIDLFATMRITIDDRPFMIASIQQENTDAIDSDMQFFYQLVLGIVTRPNQDPPRVIHEFICLHRLSQSAHALNSLYRKRKFCKRFYQNPLLFNQDERVMFYTKLDEAIKLNKSIIWSYLDLSNTSLANWEHRVDTCCKSWVGKKLADGDYDSQEFVRFRRNIGVHPDERVTNSTVEQDWFPIFPEGCSVLFNLVMTLVVNNLLPSSLRFDPSIDLIEGSLDK